MKKNFQIGYVLIVCIGVGISLFSYWQLGKLEAIRVEREIESDYDACETAIRSTLNTESLSLFSLRNFFELSYLDKTTFTRAVRPFIPLINGIQAIAWAPYQKNPGKGPSFKVLYFEPVKGNEMAAGFDLGSESNRFLAIKKAVAENRLVMTSRINLIQDKQGSKEFGFILFLPVFRDGSAVSDQSDPYQKLSGCILGVFRWDALIDKSLSLLKQKDIEIVILDMNAPEKETVLYTSLPAHETSEYISSKFQNTGLQGKAFDIILGGKQILFRMVPDKAFIAKKRTLFPIAGLAGFLILTALVCLYYYRQESEWKRVNDLVEFRTKSWRKSQERLELAVKAAGLGLWDWNIQTGHVYFNRRWAEMLGYRSDEIRPHIDAWVDLLHPDDKKNADLELQKHLEGVTPVYKSEQRLKTKEGGWKWVLDTGRVTERDVDGKPLRASGIHMDISEIKDYEAKLEHMSITDPLTGMCNRRYFFDRLNKELDRATREKSVISVAIVDIDHFKILNDTYGHLAGDFVLKQFAWIYSTVIRPYDVLARYGGEEFVLLCYNTDKKTAAGILERFQAELKGTEVVFEGQKLEFTFSGGVCDTSEFALDQEPGKILGLADERLYQAKNSGRNKVISA